MRRKSMLRKIVQIDQDKCNGCGLCVPSCAEGAIKMINGKAVLSADNLCDGLGACLGTCPQDAITIIERDAEEFDEAVVAKHIQSAGHPVETNTHRPVAHGSGGCPGSRMMTLSPPAPAAPAGQDNAPGTSQL